MLKWQKPKNRIKLNLAFKFISVAKLRKIQTCKDQTQNTFPRLILINAIFQKMAKSSNGKQYSEA